MLFDYFLEELGSTPLVLTVYDMVHELFPDAVTGSNLTKKKQRLVECASKIIAISESRKNDLIRLFNIDENKIEVIYLGKKQGGLRSHHLLGKSFEIKATFIT